MDVCHASSFFPDTQEYPCMIFSACGEAELASEITYPTQWASAYGWFTLNFIRTLRQNPHITGPDLIDLLSNKRVNQQPRFCGPKLPIFDSPIPSTDSLRTKLKLSLLSDQQLLPKSSNCLKFQRNKHTSDELLIELANTSSVAFRRLDLLLKKEKDRDGKVMSELSSPLLPLMRVQFFTFLLRDNLQPMRLQFEESIQLDVPYVLYARVSQCHSSRSECLSEGCAKGILVDWITKEGSAKVECLSKL